jgi:hypothetical protein
MDANTIADFFDTVLDSTWTRKYDIGWNGEDTHFLMGSPRNPQVRIAITDGEINVTEYDQHGCIEAETRLHGDMERQAPRVLRLLGIEA